ncbi:MAG: cobyric acid synthase [Faecalibacterium sp.]
MAKAIMIQGTTSNAGKSIVAAALCRIFAQDGYRVAPFKSQNMALNSFITEDGLEMGRAQVVQAEAAYKKPDVRMNPILLKPTSDQGSQVIVNGEVVGNMRAVEYYQHKRDYIPAILQAYQSLAAENDIIVIEGAGSPAEINLKENDIVNMGMAKMASAPVLVVGDIDRGGVFAALYGTYMLQDETEKQYIKGHVINKFRGDVQILQPGIEMMEALTPVPVVGVIPYFHLQIDDEDSLSESLTNGAISALDVAVLRLPKISNFTDFNAFEIFGGVKVRYINSAAQFGAPDLLIVPGSKNTMEDLAWLRESGLEAQLLQYASRGGAVIGVCGGYQMLCQALADPFGVEGGGNKRGIGLLPANTIFRQEKTRTRVSGVVKGAQGVFSVLNGKAFDGYEIHMGTTDLLAEEDALDDALQNESNPVQDGCQPPAQKQAATVLNEITDLQGNCSLDGISCGNVYGTYIHGFFDREEIVCTILEALAAQKGITLAAFEHLSMEAFKNREYDKLAALVRGALNMDLVYQILEEGIAAE